MADNIDVSPSEESIAVPVATVEESGVHYPIYASKNTGPVKEIISRHLSDDGTGTGGKNANGNYSGAAERFYIQPGAGEVFRIERMLVTVYDTTGMVVQEYGNLAAPLTNGITVQTAANGVQTKDLCDGIPIKYNGDWARMCYDADLKGWGNGNELLAARWTFAKSGTPIRLVGDDLESLDVVVNDDLRGLLTHYFLVQGYIE